VPTFLQAIFKPLPAQKIKIAPEYRVIHLKACQPSSSKIFEIGNLRILKYI